jgi:putative membrane protein
VSERAARWTIAALSVVVLGAVALLLLAERPGAAGLDVSRLPALNATLNGISAVLLATGFAFIRRRRIAAHVTCMLAAFAASTLFLGSYVVYHYHAGSRPFGGQGWIRAVYFVLLITHVLLAAVIVPLALTTIWRAASGRFDRHVRIARWTLPIWLYVSVTGVVIYLMLYRL